MQDYEADRAGRCGLHPPGQPDKPYGNSAGLINRAKELCLLELFTLTLKPSLALLVHVLA